MSYLSPNIVNRPYIKNCVSILEEFSVILRMTWKVRLKKGTYVKIMFICYFLFLPNILHLMS